MKEQPMTTMTLPAREAGQAPRPFMSLTHKQRMDVLYKWAGLRKVECWARWEDKGRATHHIYVVNWLEDLILDNHLWDAGRVFAHDPVRRARAFAIQDALPQ
jgi:hypothetical protein